MRRTSQGIIWLDRPCKLANRVSGRNLILILFDLPNCVWFVFVACVCYADGKLICKLVGKRYARTILWSDPIICQNLKGCREHYGDLTVMGVAKLSAGGRKRKRGKRMFSQNSHVYTRKLGLLRNRKGCFFMHKNRRILWPLNVDSYVSIFARCCQATSFKNSRVNCMAWVSGCFHKGGFHFLELTIFPGFAYDAIHWLVALRSWKVLNSGNRYQVEQLFVQMCQMNSFFIIRVSVEAELRFSVLLKVPERT